MQSSSDMLQVRALSFAYGKRRLWENVNFDVPVGAVTAVGLPFTSTLITVPVTAEVQGSMQGTLKNISEIFLRVAGEGDAWANVWPSERLRPVQLKAPQMEPQGSETRLVKVTADGRWDYQGQLEIEHRNALPLEIMAVVGNITVERGS